MKYSFIRPALYVSGMLLCALAVLMMIPAIVDLSLGNPEWTAFVGSSLLTGFVGIALTFSFSSGGHIFSLTAKQGFLLTTLSWGLLSAFSALPFLLGFPQLNYSHSVFEAVSGLTTTGSTALKDIDSMPAGILLWRALLQWIGGIGIIVMAIIILPFLRVGGMQLFQLENSDRSTKVVPRAAQLMGLIACAYVVLTLLCITAFSAFGMSFFDAVCHAMTTVSTGGFSTHNESFGYFSNPAIHWTAIIFMISGAIPFVTYLRFSGWRGGQKKIDEQIRGFFIVILAAVFVMTCIVIVETDAPPLEALRLGAFNSISIITTSGFATTDYLAWGPFAIGLFLAMIFCGGCTGSTTGGIKIFRYQVLIKVVFHYMMKLTSPNRIVRMRFSGRPLPEDVPLAVLAFIAAYLGSIVVFTVFLSACGLDLVTSFSGAAAVIRNVGPALGDLIGPAGNYSLLPDFAVWVLAGGMILGRLELFTVLVVLTPSFWRD